MADDTQKQQGAFYIENVAGTKFRTLDGNGMPDWTEDRNEALGFTHRYHADVFAADDPEDVRIREAPYVLQYDKPERRAPVQGFREGIPWSMHLEAYEAYCKKYSPQKALIEGGCRGGFGCGELDMFIPGWRERLPEVVAKHEYVKGLEEQVAALQEEVARAKAEAPWAAVAAIKFSLESEQGDEFLAYWHEGEFDKCRRNWPDAPDACYIGADPLFKQPPRVCKGTNCTSDGTTPHSPECIADYEEATGMTADVARQRAAEARARNRSQAIEMFDSFDSEIGTELSECETAEFNGHKVVMSVWRDPAKPGVRNCNIYIDGFIRTYEEALDILQSREQKT